MNRCCKTCRHLEVKPNSAGRRVVRKDGVYRCIAPMPEMPSSVTEAHGWSDQNLAGRAYMSGDRGTNCPTWEPLA